MCGGIDDRFSDGISEIIKERLLQDQKQEISKIPQNIEDVEGLDLIMEINNADKPKRKR